MARTWQAHALAGTLTHAVPFRAAVRKAPDHARTTAPTTHHSCAFKNPDGRPMADVRAAHDTWASAPECPRGTEGASNWQADSWGRRWGWEAGRPCAFKSGGGDRQRAQQQMQQHMQKQMQQHTPQQQYILWTAAPRCGAAAAAYGYVWDTEGRQWGWQDGQSCAVRPAEDVLDALRSGGSGGGGGAAATTAASDGTAAGAAAGGGEGEGAEEAWADDFWRLAPVCAAARTEDNSVRDALGRWWGWQGAQSCKYARAGGPDAPAAAAAPAAGPGPA